MLEQVITILLIPIAITLVFSLFFLLKGDDIKNYFHVRKMRRNSKLELNEDDDTPFAYIGDIQTSIISCVGTGIEKIRSSNITSILHNDPIDLPEHISERRIRIEKERKTYTTKQVTLIRYDADKTDFVEDQHLTLEFRLSDYFTYQAINARLDESFEDQLSIRESYLANVESWREPIPFLANGVGVIGTVITSDNKVVLTKRRMNTGVRPGEWDVSVVEAIDPTSDRSSTQSGPDVIQSIVRGVDQEVGINVEPEDVHILGLALDTKYYQWNIFATIYCKETYQEIIQLNSGGIHGSNEVDKYTSVAVEITPFAELFLRNDLWDAGKWALYWALLYHKKNRSLVRSQLSKELKRLQGTN